MNKENKNQNNKWSLKKTILFIVLVLLLFLSLFSCGLNAFKTTMNNETETTENINVENDFIKEGRGIKKTNVTYQPVVVGNDIHTIYINYSYTDINTLFDDMLNNGVTINDFYIDTSYSDDTITTLFAIIYQGSSNTSISLRFYLIIDNSTNMPLYFFLYYYDGNGGSQNSLDNVVATNLQLDYILYLRGLINCRDFCNSTAMVNGTSYNVGTINDKISFFISTTPFINNDDIGGSTEPNPKYEYAPSINNESLGHTLIDVDMDNGQAFAYVGLTSNVTYNSSTYVYDVDLTLYVGLEGVINTYSIDNAFTMTANELSFSSETFLLFNFDSENENTYIYLEIDVNSSSKYSNEYNIACTGNYSLSNFYYLGGINNTESVKNIVNSLNTEQAYNNGYNIGNKEGYSTGYDEGEQVGYDAGYTNGENYGYTNGYETGYSYGFENGQKDEVAQNGIKKLFNAIMNAPYNIFNGILNFEIFGVNLFNLFSFIFTTMLIIAIVGIITKR